MADRSKILQTGTMIRTVCPKRVVRNGATSQLRQRMAQTRCRGKMIGLPLLVLKKPGEKASWIARVSKVAARLPQEARRWYIDVSRWPGRSRSGIER